MKRILVLEDGSWYEGEAFGANTYKTGELVFNTSMTGYQEILTDPSYYGQIVMLTYPLIGNYGINRDDYESMKPSCFGLVIKDLCTVPSNFRSCADLDSYLLEHGIPGISNVDTRAITKAIREKGTMKACFCDSREEIEPLLKKLQSTDFLHDQVSCVSTKSTYPVPGRGKLVVVMDFGVKLSILRELSKRDCDVIVVPYNTSAKQILSYHPDGVLLSNGPGDPSDLPDVIEQIKILIDHTVVSGISLGCQLISLACGAKTYRLRFGHRGANHPVKDLLTGKVEITSQNHGFAVDIDSLKNTRLEMTYQALNDKSCEGVQHKDYPCFSMQFHPEASAGPLDSENLFDHFMDVLEKENHYA